jgi:HSP20 family protein
MSLFDEEADVRLATKKVQEPQEGALTVDVFKSDGDVVIQSTIAGTTEKDLDISILNDMVTIRGTRKPDSSLQVDEHFYQELYWGTFSRSIILPEEVDPDKAKASLKNGILTIKLPTKDKSNTKKLKVETSDI